MKKSILHNKKGVTVLEGLIALGLLAMVAAGAFAVLLSSARRSSQPDVQEEMLLAVQKANDALQQYAIDQQSNTSINNSYMLPGGLCGDDNFPLAPGHHYIGCMLPAVCIVGYFEYTVSSADAQSMAVLGSDKISGFDSSLNHSKITYRIRCNGVEGTEW